MLMQKCDAQELVGKIPVGIPKTAIDQRPPPQQKPTSRLTRRPRVDLIPTDDDPMTLDLLKDVAIFVGSDWRSLVLQLDLPTPVVALIEKRHDKARDVLYDVLVTWAGRQPIRRNKTEALFRALVDSRKYGLAEQLADLVPHLHWVVDRGEDKDAAAAVGDSPSMIREKIVDLKTVGRKESASGHLSWQGILRKEMKSYM